MADKLAEQLSALMDDECPAVEVPVVLHRLSKQVQLQDKWQRYHVISDTLKNNLPEHIDQCFCERMRAAIEQEPALHTGVADNSFKSRLYKPVAGVAIAASVAAAVTLSYSYNTLNSHDNQIVAEQITDSAANPSAKIELAVESPQSRLNKLLVNHSEYASRNSVYGVLPYVTLSKSNYQASR